jgi:molybdopterin converting factor small subunit
MNNGRNAGTTHNTLVVMKVKVLLFGAEEESVGRSSVDVDVVDAPRARDVLKALCERWPQLKRARLAVNHTFVTGDEKIGAKDEVALIGMVSGG